MLHIALVRYKILTANLARRVGSRSIADLNWISKKNLKPGGVLFSVAGTKGLLNLIESFVSQP